MEPGTVVTRDAWTRARVDLLAEEKAALRRLDEASAARRRLPWVAVETPYVFETADGERTLAELFGGHEQLIVYHFMFGPGWEEGCLGCSFVCDHFDGADLHLSNHGVSLVAVGRAPFAELDAFRRRMGWRFPLVSSHGGSFNYDFGASFTAEQVASGESVYNFGSGPPMGEEVQGVSVFARDGAGGVYHTYSSFARGLDPLIGAHALLDLTPLGRNERGVMDWVRHHDRYGVEGAASFPVIEGAGPARSDGDEACCAGEGA